MSRRNPTGHRDELFALVVGVVVIAALYFARIILIPIAVATLLSFILTPAARLLERVRLGRMFSSIAVVLLAVALVGGVGWTITKQFSAVIQQLPDYQENISDKIAALRGTQTGMLGAAAKTLNDFSHELSSSPGDGATNSNQRARRATTKEPIPVQVVQPASLPLDSVQNALGLLTGFFLVFVFTLFMIIRREDLRNRFISLVGTGHLHTATQALDDAGARVSQYLRFQLIVNTGYGAVIAIGLHLIGLPGALLWGVIVGILRFIPYVGPPLGGIGPVLLSVAIFPGWHAALMTLGLFVVVELAVAHMVEPMLYGDRTGLSPVAVLLAAVFWTAIWGPIGLVVSTPLTVCLVVLGQRVPRLAFLNTLLGDEPVLTPQAHYYQRLLAMDSREARDVLETSLKDCSLEKMYEKVLIPALGLAEQDRHNNELDDATEKFISENTRELVEDLYESRSAIAIAENNGHNLRLQHENDPSGEKAASANIRVACVPVSDQADETVAIMLAQILNRAGYRADAVPLGTPPEMFSVLKDLSPDVVCLSALPPFAISPARTLHGKVRAQFPQARIIVGLWNYVDELKVAMNRLGLKEESAIVTEISQVLKVLSPESEPVPASD